jgi:putative tryptophan/tyrosine transport system substrate-binding protein
MNKTVVSIVVLLCAVLGIGGYFFIQKEGDVTPQSKKVVTIGILNGFDFFRATEEGFKAKMATLGYVEGANVTYITEKVDNISPKDYQDALGRLVSAKVDLIMTFPTEASIEGKQIAKTSGIPLVFSNAYVEGMNIIDSIQAPGNNLTGVRYPGPDIVVKRLEVLKELIPDAKTVLVPYDKNYPTVPTQLAALHKKATEVGVTIVEAPVASPPELQVFLENLIAKKQKVDAILTIAEIVSAAPPYVEILGTFSEKHTIPWAGALTLKKDGYTHESLFGVSVDNFAVGELAALLAQKVLNGTSAGTIPVSSAEIVLGINTRVAEQMGITPSEGILSVANTIVR